MKRRSLKKLVVLISGLILSAAASLQVMAGQWRSDEIGFWFVHDDGSYPVYSWEWIDADGDGIYQCYAFDENGYLYLNSVTPDGYYVGADGAWYENAQPVSRVFFHNAYIAPVEISVPKRQVEYQRAFTADGTPIVTRKYTSIKTPVTSTKSSSGSSTSSKSGTSKSSNTSQVVTKSDIVTSKYSTAKTDETINSSSAAKTNSNPGPDVENTSYDKVGPGADIPSGYSSQTVRPVTDQSTENVSAPKGSGFIERDGEEDEDQD